MRIFEIINEAATAPLYHGTTFATAMEIVEDGCFMPFTSIAKDKKLRYGISSTRSPRLSHIDHNPSQNAWEKDSIEGFNVIFVLDQLKIRERYKIIPFDYFKDNTTNSFFNQEVNKLRNIRSESEEFIEIGKGNKLPLKGNVTKIIYFSNSFKNPNDEPDVDTFVAFKKMALRNNIPVVLNKTLFGYGDNDRPWNNELRQSMISNPDKNEIKIDPNNWEIKEILTLAKKYDHINGEKMSTEQLSTAFDKDEQFKIWNFWLRMNGRAPSVPSAPITNNTFRSVFNSIKNADPKTKTIYKKIFPFRTENSPKTPEDKKLAGLKSKK